jgi:galactokinase
MRAAVVEAYRRRFGGDPEEVVRAPGRVNLLGEHTDYNDGFVLPLAIDRAVWIALRRRSDRRVVVHSREADETIEFELDGVERGGPRWGEYIKGVAWALSEAGRPLSGWQGVVAGDVPIGAGLSSSAALEVAAARALAAVSGWNWEPPTMARLAQRAENEWVGVPCGIMDQLSSACGVVGHALLIDCRTLTVDPVPLPPDVAVVVLDTGTRRAVGASAYEERRRQCAEAAQRLGAAALRDVTTDDLAERGAALEPVLLKRARHVVSENERTLRAAEALRRGQPAEVGALMNASHVSMRDDFEISTPELEAMVNAARGEPDCLGARLTGAGFGGCAVALVSQIGPGMFERNVREAYFAAVGREAKVYVCRAAGGAEAVG